MSSRKEAKRARRQKRKQRSWNGLAQRPYDESFFPGRAEPRDIITLEPPGFEKMSVVLEEFVRPFVEEAAFTTENGFRNLINFAVAAWNISLLPEDQQREVLDDSLNKILAEQPADVHSSVRALMNAMITHKRAYFSQNNRPIMGIELTHTGTDWRLDVISALPIQ